MKESCKLAVPCFERVTDGIRAPLFLSGLREALLCRAVQFLITVRQVSIDSRLVSMPGMRWQQVDGKTPYSRFPAVCIAIDYSEYTVFDDYPEDCSKHFRERMRMIIYAIINLVTDNLQQ